MLHYYAAPPKLAMFGSVWFTVEMCIVCGEVVGSGAVGMVTMVACTSPVILFTWCCSSLSSSIAALLVWRELTV